MKAITKEQFDVITRKLIEESPLDSNGNVVGYWKDAESRWRYFETIASIVERYSSESQSALELGTMGVSVFAESDLMDYEKHINYYRDGRLKYIHDARTIPWPVETKKYDWFIASRVYHHLWPVQRECFEEAMRIAHNVILVVPETLPPNGGTVILPQQFRAWNKDVRPDLSMPVGQFGYLYLWLSVDKSRN